MRFDKKKCVEYLLGRAEKFSASPQQGFKDLTERYLSAACAVDAAPNDDAAQLAFEKSGANFLGGVFKFMVLE